MYLMYLTIFAALSCSELGQHCKREYSLLAKNKQRADKIEKLLEPNLIQVYSELR